MTASPNLEIAPYTQTVTLGRSDLQVTPICLGTMTFGEQVNEAQTHAILDHAVAAGLNFLDTAEMYSVPPKAETFGRTETYIGNWLAARPGLRQRLVIASKVAGPSRGMPWIREGSPDMSAADIEASCNASLKRLQTDVIDLYQIHWPNRNVPSFGAVYFDPRHDVEQTSILVQLEAMDRLIKAGKIRHVGLSNETPYGIHEFVRVAEQHGLPRVVTVQNPYCLINRVLETGLDETTHRLGVAHIPYSPLGFGLLTGKYDERGIEDPTSKGRMALYERMKQQRWGRPESLAAARRYNALAREHGLTPTQMACAWVYRNWRVTSTIIGVTSIAQLDEQLAAWTTSLPRELLKAIDQIRWEMRDPAQ